MKKINKKGFLLIETLIVTVFIMTVFIFIYNNALPIMAEYELQMNYDDLDSVYGANLVKNMVKSDSHFAAFKASITSSVKYIDISNCNSYDDANFCANLKKYLNINNESITVNGKTYQADNIILTKYVITDLQAAITSNTIFSSSKYAGLSNYITNLEDYSNTVEDNSNNYRIIISRTIVDGTTVTKKYANIEVIV